MPFPPVQAARHMFAGRVARRTRRRLRRTIRAVRTVTGAASAIQLAVHCAGLFRMTVRARGLRLQCAAVLLVAVHAARVPRRRGHPLCTMAVRAPHNRGLRVVMRVAVTACTVLMASVVLRQSSLGCVASRAGIAPKGTHKIVWAVTVHARCLTVVL